MQGALLSKCGKYGENCKCDLGGTIFYGYPTLNGRSIDISKDHWELDAGLDKIQCKASVFGASKSDG